MSLRQLQQLLQDAAREDSTLEEHLHYLEARAATGARNEQHTDSVWLQAGQSNIRLHTSANPLSYRCGPG